MGARARRLLVGMLLPTNRRLRRPRLTGLALLLTRLVLTGLALLLTGLVLARLVLLLA